MNKHIFEKKFTFRVKNCYNNESVYFHMHCKCGYHMVVPEGYDMGVPLETPTCEEYWLTKVLNN